MSSEFYLTNLSRNLVRVGPFGYRENVALRLLPGAAGEAVRRPERSRRPVITVRAASASGRAAGSAAADFAGFSLRRLTVPATGLPQPEQGP